MNKWITKFVPEILIHFMGTEPNPTQPSLAQAYYKLVQNRPIWFGMWDLCKSSAQPLYR